MTELTTFVPSLSRVVVGVAKQTDPNLPWKLKPSRRVTPADPAMNIVLKALKPTQLQLEHEYDVCKTR